MHKLVILLALLGFVLGAPQTKSLVSLLDGRIVGGENADIVDHPFTLSMTLLGLHLCGAALISREYALTAAHCITLGLPYSVRAGSSIRNGGGQLISVQSAIRHPNYSSSTIDFDIGILRLASSVTIATAAPIALAPEGGAPLAGSTATITGWGATSEGGSSASILQVVQVPVVSQANCRAAYGQNAVTDRMFCVGLLGVGGKDACQGDSGGPVVIGGLLTGLVSWGTGCARPNHPGVKTSIPPLRSWIRQQTGV